MRLYRNGDGCFRARNRSIDRVEVVCTFVWTYEPIPCNIEGNCSIRGMRFEWDEAKHERNLLKHNVRFETAALVFDDPFALTQRDE